MDKLEKVIKGLECCLDLDNPDDACAKCPYYRKNAYGENDCMRGELMPDAIELLKEKQPIEIQSNSYGLACCPKCSAIIEDITSDGKRVAFCRICGQRIKWKDNKPKGGEHE